jgi:hypothetical protein
MSDSVITIRGAGLSENPPSRLHDEVARQLCEATGREWSLTKLSGYWLVYAGTTWSGGPVVQRKGRLSAALALAVGRPVEIIGE